MNTEVNVLLNNLYKLKLLKEKSLKDYLTYLTDSEKTLYQIQGMCKHIWIQHENTYKCKTCSMEF